MNREISMQTLMPEWSTSDLIVRT